MRSLSLLVVIEYLIAAIVLLVLYGKEEYTNHIVDKENIGWVVIGVMSLTIIGCALIIVPIYVQKQSIIFKLSAEPKPIAILVCLAIVAFVFAGCVGIVVNISFCIDHGCFNKEIATPLYILMACYTFVFVVVGVWVLYRIWKPKQPESPPRV
jgi:hypothetical protein